ncbi:hypothetical protein EIK79_07175 [Halocatena pleomorpha]|uniref:Uncharacterized protein n=2 Tax=Halocatena pleomorpha TaxID=1785090 RepID=A0A3P3RDA6_9EURY|nr:hypothetical protein EIK79_07175 [Halocatena pleomorpha]
MSTTVSANTQHCCSTRRLAGVLDPTAFHYESASVIASDRGTNQATDVRTAFPLVHPASA